jgi:hypothetical protein
MGSITRAVFGAVCVLVLSAATTLPAREGEYPTVFASRPTAEELEARAHDLMSAPAQFGSAARLLVQAAELREPGDPQRLANLRQAGQLTYYSRSVPRARSLFERTAREALMVGDVFQAADALLDASSLARELRDYAAAADLLRRAELLSLSPLLSGDERAFLERRVHGAAV